MTQSHDAPKVLSSERVHDRWLGLRVDRLRYPSGYEGTAEVVEHRGGIVIVAFDSDARLLLVRQDRHPAGRELLELPAGTLEPDEAPELCAERELQEETGYRPGRLERLGNLDKYWKGFLDGDGPAFHTIPQRFPFDKLQDQEVKTLVLLEIVQGPDVRMVE